MTVLDAIAYAVNVENQGTSLEGDHALGVGSLTVTSVYNFPDAGSIDVNGDVYDYTAIDEDLNTVTLSGVTTAAYDDGASVELSPAQPVWYATVVAGSDQPGFNAMVPLYLVPFLAEQFWDEGIPVRLESIQAGEYEWKVVDVPGQQPIYDATSAPIIVTTDGGEAVRIDGDGITAYTNDPVLLRVVAVLGPFTSLAANDAYIFANHPAGNFAHQYDSADMSFLGGALGQFSDVSANPTHLFAINSANDIAKFDATTLVEVIGGGFPIAGTFARIAADSSFVFAVDGSSDIAKYNASSGASVGGGFPIAGTFADVATDGTSVYAVDANSDINKYAVSDGSAAGGSFPIAGTFTDVTVHDGYILAIDSTGLRKFDAATADEVVTSGFPIAGTFADVAANADKVVALSAGQLMAFNGAAAFQSVRLDSSSGIFEAVGPISAPTADLGAAVIDAASIGVAEIESLDVSGAASLPLLGHSDQKTTASNFTPTSTANVTITELAMSCDVGATTDVVWVDCDAEVLINTAATINVIELLIDGAAQGKQLRNAGALNARISGYKRWRITGLAAGSHTIGFRTRNTAGATSATVVGTMTGASYWTST